MEHSERTKLETEFLVLAKDEDNLMEIDIADRLLQNGVDVNARNEKGQTALHIYVMRDPEAHDLIGRYISLLLENGIDPNIQDEDGNTAIHVARNPLSDYIHILQANPNIHLKNKEGISVFDVLKNAGYYDPEDDSYQHRTCKKLIDNILNSSKVELPSVGWAGVEVNNHKPNDKLQIQGTLKIPHEISNMYYIGDNMLCVRGDIPSKVSCVDISTGEILWSKRNDTFLYWIYEAGILYFTTKINSNCTYIAVDSRTGKEIWVSKFGNSRHTWKGTGAFNLENSIVFSTNGALVALDKKNGKKIYKIKLNNYNLSVKAIVRDNEFIIQGPKGFYCYNMLTGDIIKHIAVSKVMPEVPGSHKADYLLLENSCWYVSEESYLCTVDFATEKYQEYKIDIPKGFLNKEYTINKIDNTLQIKILNYSSDACISVFDLGANKFIDTQYLKYDRSQAIEERNKINAEKKLHWEFSERILYINQKPFEMPNYRGDDRIEIAKELDNNIYVVAQAKGIEYGKEDIGILHIIY